MNWKIITDSSCEYIGENKENLSFLKVPFVLRIGNTDFVDDENINVPQMIDAMEKEKEISHSSCPAPGAFTEVYRNCDAVVAITISSGVSGSYNSATTAAAITEEKHPERSICVIDSKSAASGLSLLSKKAESLINSGADFQSVKSALQTYADKMHTVFALSSFGNLVKNGRMNKLVGMLAGKLGIWGIGSTSEEGKIVVIGKERGPEKMLSAIIAHMKEHSFSGGDVAITHCMNVEMAERLANKIRENWSCANISILKTGGLCSYYAERGGLIVAYEE